MTEPGQCERCGGTIPPDAPAEVCPPCLLEAGLGSDPGTGAAGSMPFSFDELEKAFPQLQIKGQIGQGGMGVIYKARQRSLDRDVALKILPRTVADDPAFAERFGREARALAKLNHPNIVAVHESGKSGGLFYLIMEYVDGVNLRQARQEGKLAPEEALAIVPQICDALQYAHDQGVVHRDIKPDNILLDRKGRVKIADFGLAKLLQPKPGDPSLTGDGQVMGTYHYMAPEQIQSPKKVDHRADIFSLGVVFYELLTGDLPIGRFPPPSEKVEVDVRLDRVVLRALEQERERRYQRIDEVKTDVHRIGESGGAPAAAPRRQNGVQAVRRRNGRRGPRLSRLAVAGIVLLPAAAIVGVVVTALGARDETGLIIGALIALIGVILSAIAKGAIRSDPANLCGRRLAMTGVLLPMVLVVLIVAFGLLVSHFNLAAMEGARTRAESAERAAMEEYASKTELIFRSMIEEKLTRLDHLVGTRRIELLAELIDPRRREWILELDVEGKLEPLREKEELGLALIDSTTTLAPFSGAKIDDCTIVDSNTRKVTITLPNEKITFPVVRVNREWFFGVGSVEREKIPRLRDRIPWNR